MEKDPATVTEPARPHRGKRGRALDVALACARPALTALPLIAVALLVLDATVLFLPSEPLVWRLTLTRLVVLAGFAALLAAGARLRHLRSRLDPAIGVLVLSGLLATVLGRHDAAPLRALLTGVAFYYLCVGVLRTDPGAWRALVVVALVTAVIAGAVALAQVRAGTPTGFCRSLSLRDVSCRSGGLVRATGTFPNPNLLAAAVVLLTPIGALTARTARQRGERAVHLLLIALAYAGLLVTYSRGAYLAAAGGAAGHVQTCDDCELGYRVLDRDGRPSPGFTWGDANRTDSQLDALAGEGIRITGDRADPSQRLTSGQLQSLLPTTQSSYP